MNKQYFRHYLVVAVVIIIIAGVFLWMRASYQRMQADCELRGGSFYSISFTQNICVDGSIVYQLD